jgi:hypothetical protein
MSTTALVNADELPPMQARVGTRYEIVRGTGPFFAILKPA